MKFKETLIAVYVSLCVVAGPQLIGASLPPDRVWVIGETQWRVDELAVERRRTYTLPLIPFCIPGIIMFSAAFVKYHSHA